MRTLVLVLAALSIACTSASGGDDTDTVEPLSTIDRIDPEDCGAFITTPLEAVEVDRQMRWCIANGWDILALDGGWGWDVADEVCPEAVSQHQWCPETDPVCVFITGGTWLAVGDAVLCERDGGTDCETPEQINGRADVTIDLVCG